MQETAFNIYFDPLLDIYWLTGITLCFAFAGLLLLIKRPSGWFLRLLASAILLVMLTNPSLIEEQRQPINDVVVLISDESSSQLFGGRSERMTDALDYLKENIAQLPDKDVVATGFSKGFRLTEQTNLFQSLYSAISDIPLKRLAGVVFITDGRVHDVPEDLKALSAYGPVHTILTGEKNEKDRRVHIVKAPSYGIVGEELELILRIEQTDNIQAKSAALTLWQNGQEIEQRTVPVGRDIPITFKLDRAGYSVFQIETNTLDDELTAMNNKTALTINGIRDRLRVLLVSGQPHNGERTWRNLLKSDPGVDLVHFTILRPPEKTDTTPTNELSLIAFPIRELFELKIDDFDLIIFDRFKRRNLLPNRYFMNIANFVRKGGALLESSGPDFAELNSMYFTPLGQILPGRPTGQIHETAFEPRITDLGKKHPVTENLPDFSRRKDKKWGKWFRQVNVEPVKGDTLMHGPYDSPLLILDKVGNGRVAQLSSDQIWLWARGYDGGGPHAELLRRTSHWLMKEPELEEDALNVSVKGDNISIKKRNMTDDQVIIKQTTPLGRGLELSIGVGADGWASHLIEGASPGIHKFDDGTHIRFAVVGALNSPELSALTTTDTLLSPVAKATDAAVKWWFENPGLQLRALPENRTYWGRDWIGFRNNHDSVITGTRQTSLMPDWLALILAATLFALAWWRESKH